MVSAGKALRPSPRRRAPSVFLITIAGLGLSAPGPACGQSSLDPTAALLAEIIRVDTSNPPGREGLIGDLLAPRFKAAGFEVDIIPTPEPGKSHFIARLRGDGSKRPILLAAHADVVGVEREKWTVILRTNPLRLFIPMAPKSNP